MANPAFDPEKVLGDKIIKMDKEELCEFISALCRKVEACVDGLTVHVYKIANRFFGETVTVAGLLTGKDVSEQLSGKDLGDELFFPAVMLRADGDVFLDDMTPAKLSQKLGGIPVCACPSDGAEVLKALLGISDDQ